MDATWRGLVNDPDKLDSLVDAMSRCMGKMLSIKDPEVGGGHRTLGQTLYEEKECFPTREQLDELEQVQRAFTFVIKAHRTANKMRSESCSNGNLVLTPYADAETFRKSWTFTRPLDSGDESRLKVGGLCITLYRDVVPLVYEWLLKCDEMMMIAFDDMPKGEWGDESAVVTTARDLAEAIARRMTLLQPAVPEENDEDLSTRALQLRAGHELQRTSLQADEHQRTDLVALRSFETLAREGPFTERGTRVVNERMAHIHYVVRKPPMELGINGANAQHMNLPLLARACNPALDNDVRKSMVHQWQQQYGLYAATAAVQAIQKIQMWDSHSQKPFIKVLQQTASPSGVPMPVMPFVQNKQKWRFLPTVEKRNTLDWMGRRVVRLTSMVLQLLGHGALERGVLCGSIVSPIATQAVVEARMVMELLNIKRESYSLGTNLLRFCEDISDGQSHLDAAVDDAMLHVSLFSTLELLSIFNPQSPALRCIMTEFTKRTRKNLAFVMPAQYIAFAYDAMALLLPVIRQRRERAGLALTQRQNPICTLLRHIPRVREWSPINGKLHLDLNDVKCAPAVLVHVLKLLAEQGRLVEYKRPYLGKQRHAAKKAFVFDSAQLVALLSDRPLLRGPSE